MTKGIHSSCYISDLSQLLNYNMTHSPARASSPFDHVKAVVILRSSNGVDFRVFKLFLTLASPLFETLFDLPQPSEGTNTDMEIRDGLPVIPVSEDSKTRFTPPLLLSLYFSRGSCTRGFQRHHQRSRRSEKVFS
ncbi:hypothetical protein BKA82DRAFT_390182 [Pisolithus tinctorius]|uniref:BTB domain-containing protein n=1 Tax=Pisolithus tinctorius Marx 270 TaxID=870435 RepID=A0A0C3JEV0_PISTI|nr:hypothetical protein BKA82DRAFT_390182 [Pisolithus tinctorius]KIO07613.1 hypothetical protein M404DRAFT_390182 [Pisolithus tinctorius Marx 270]